MKFVIDINQKHSESIQKLINQGSYNSVAQFVNVAIENQIHIENSDLEPADDVKGLNPKIGNDNARWESYIIQNISTNPKVVMDPAFDKLTLGRYVKDESQIWLWGQINRIFPVKIGVRILFKELQNEQYINLESFASLAASVAGTIGRSIRDHEEKYSLKREEKISAGLPLFNEEKSLERFKSQFLLYKRKDGFLDGAMSMLKFANVNQDNGKVKLGLTKAGLEFAKIVNPVIDDSSFESGLSEEEIHFYLRHVKENVRSEYSAIMWMLNKMKAGVKERDSLNIQLKKEYAEIWKATDAMINTQRSGLLARMYELRLIEKEKDGITVKYHISKSGKSFISNN
jgi:hypothetical protein